MFPALAQPTLGNISVAPRYGSFGWSVPPHGAPELGVRAYDGRRKGWVPQTTVRGARVAHLLYAAKVDVTAGTLVVVAACVVAVGFPGGDAVVAGFGTVVG
jgi:hypothetical protein